MKFFQRASWTAQLPTPFREYHPTLPFFVTTPQVEFLTPDENYLYLYTSPVDALQRLLNSISHLADINYNYALPSNELGCYVIRGQSNKCLDSENLRVLLLVGRNEEPSDVLKTNQTDFLNTPHTYEPPGEISTLSPSVHYFDLTEYLTSLGFYQGPNTGNYTDSLKTAIEVFQYFNGFPVTGEWDKLTGRGVLRDIFKPTTRNSHEGPPVGSLLNA
jgi:Putative peptidoglycan binding domain